MNSSQPTNFKLMWEVRRRFYGNDEDDDNDLEGYIMGGMEVEVPTRREWTCNLPEWFDEKKYNTEWFAARGLKLEWANKWNGGSGEPMFCVSVLPD
jgi:hypothetical protein